MTTARAEAFGTEIAEFAAELGDGATDVLDPAGSGMLAATDQALIMNIPVTMKVVLGSATMPVSALGKLARGSLVKLDRKVGEPVEIHINGRMVARGQVVILDEESSRFGVSLTQVGGFEDAQK